MSKIAVICPYFGQLPQNINATLVSMENNKLIDWILLTDSGDKYVGVFSNIKIINCSFNDVQLLIKTKIGTIIDSPYKLCDYKPTFGELFSDYFKEYDFWGYYDLDVIYGDLSKFITEDKLNKYDKIYDLGHFSIYRNTNEICQAYRGNCDIYVPYREILNTKCICVFDETYDDLHQGINGILLHMGYKVYQNRNDFADISIIWKNFVPNGVECGKRDYYFEYVNGKLFMRRKSKSTYLKEVAYVHLQQKKHIPEIEIKYNHYYILPKGYIDTDRKIDKYFYFYDMHWNWYLKFRIRRKLTKIRLLGKSIDIIYK